jgi:signal transduction histidine kinase
VKPRRFLRVVQYAPLVAAALLAGVWLSVPDPLRSQMMSVPAATDSGARAHSDREAVARTALENDEYSRASASWGDVRFQAAAKSTQAATEQTFQEAVRGGRAKPFLIDQRDSRFSAMARFARDFPDARIDAYLVPAPARPPLMRVVGVPSARPAEERFSAAWAEDSGGPGQSIAFDPAAWNGRMPADLATIQALHEGRDDELTAYSSYAFQEADALYRAYVFGPDPGAADDLSDHHRNTEKLNAAEERLCDACHLYDEASLSYASSALPPVALGVAAYLGGPVNLAVVPQYTTRGATATASIGRKLALWAISSSETTHIATLPAVLQSDSRDAWATVVWATPADPASGQTMLFSATFPEDPHAGFTAWKASDLRRVVFGTRLWLSLHFPWLLTAACTLLGVTLVAAPFAFAAEKRAIRAEQAQSEIARIQRDAHDRVYNRLTALSKRVDESAEEASANAERLGAVAADIRSTVADLQAILGNGTGAGAELGDDALLPQLRAVAAAQGALHQLSVELVAKDEIPALPARLGWDLQCVLDEALTNAARHGRAATVNVVLEVTSGRLRMRVDDDGVGAAGSVNESAGSTGLSGMQVRLAPWGGFASLERRQDGSTLEVEVPLPPQGN